ncbi:MAG: four helix bundle protein [Candidatus Gracilibacteria bacterium]|nr:four helix bundle protein [Candidatus Gracilibacteria bacterium]MDD2909247.1 four helix bundle protein [Candidatus Gracilibacteria bacterium]
MAIYENLPVYKTSYDLLIITFSTIKAFPKEYKYSIGDKIKSETIDLILNIYKANLSKDKTEKLILAREKIEIIRLFSRVCRDLKIINLNKYIEINLLIESISKQLFAWSKSLG